MNGDPFWITAKWTDVCESCGEKIRKGSKAFYYPRTKAIFCERDGLKEAESFNAAVQDEEFMNAQFPSVQ